MEHQRCSIIYMGRQPWLPPLPPMKLRHRHRSSPSFRQQPPPEASHHAAAARHASSPSHVAAGEDDEAVADRPRPTTAEPSSPRSKPFITTATTSTFQIRRGRKPTLIIVATRGETSSPVINKFNSIPLRSWPISDLNRPQQPISGHLVFSVHANEPPSASRTQQAIQQHAHERHLHAGQQQRPFCTISSSPPSSRSNGKHLAPAKRISRLPIRPCTIVHESTAIAARSCPFSIKFPAVRSVLITKQPWPDLDGHDRSNRRLPAPHDVSS
ncbi:hypothetical protein ACLOJK_007578 [Asimina triloba]